MNDISNPPCSPPVPVRQGGLLNRLRVKWHNWRVRKTGRAYRHLCKAMKDDPDYAKTWQCAIACVIFDSNVCTLNHANEVADIMMKNLFGVRNHPDHP